MKLLLVIFLSIVSLLNYSESQNFDKMKVINKYVDYKESLNYKRELLINWFHVNGVKSSSIIKILHLNVLGKGESISIAKYDCLEKNYAECFKKAKNEAIGNDCLDYIVSDDNQTMYLHE